MGGSQGGSGTEAGRPARRARRRLPGDGHGRPPRRRARGAIRVAGAPALGRGRPPSSVREALVVLGLRGVRTLAFAQFSRRLVGRWGVVDQLLWELSLATAAGTQLLLEAREPAVADDA